MKIRKHFLPKNLTDSLVSLFVVIIIPVVYWFELFVVVPHFYTIWSSLYNIHFTIGSYILLNLVTNYVGIIFCDTSINGRILPSAGKQNWRFCIVCESVTPPRSWHCDKCGTCILKRDHHCIFTGCCIGHNNQRYFLMFVFYIFLATVYASFFNLQYIYKFMELNNWVTILKVLFPLFMLFVEISFKQLSIFLILIVVVACIFTGILFHYHANLIINGLVTNEKKYTSNPYNMGWRDNLRASLGRRWYLVWMSPFVESELTHDGIYWKIHKSGKYK